MIEYTPEMVRASGQLQRYGEQRRQTEDNICLCVIQCRSVGLTWAQIGSAIGVTPQAAWERYGLTLEQKQQRSRQTNASHHQLELIPAATSVVDAVGGLEEPHRQDDQGQT